MNQPKLSQLHHIKKTHTHKVIESHQRTKPKNLPKPQHRCGTHCDACSCWWRPCTPRRGRERGLGLGAAGEPLVLPSGGQGAGGGRRGGSPEWRSRGGWMTPCVRMSRAPYPYPTGGNRTPHSHSSAPPPRLSPSHAPRPAPECCWVPGGRAAGRGGAGRGKQALQTRPENKSQECCWKEREKSSHNDFSAFLLCLLIFFFYDHLSLFFYSFISCDFFSFPVCVFSLCILPSIDIFF